MDSDIIEFCARLMALADEAQASGRTGEIAALMRRLETELGAHEEPTGPAAVRTAVGPGRRAGDRVHSGTALPCDRCGRYPTGRINIFRECPACGEM